MADLCKLDEHRYFDLPDIYLCAADNQFRCRRRESLAEGIIGALSQTSLSTRQTLSNHEPWYTFVLSSIDEFLARKLKNVTDRRN